MYGKLEYYRQPWIDACETIDYNEYKIMSINITWYLSPPS